MVSLAFLATCAAVIVAPGPMFTLLVNRSLRYGRRLGFVTIMGNTTGLAPQFIPPHANAAGATAVLAAVQMAMSASWYSFVVLALGQFRKLLSRPAVKRRIEQATGLVLVGLGVRMLTLAKA